MPPRKPESTADFAYVDLLKKTLTRSIQPEKYEPLTPLRGSWKAAAYEPLRRLLAAGGLELVRRFDYKPGRRRRGRDRPPEGLTMIGMPRLDNIEFCVKDLLLRKVPGDFLEAGVWRGGAAIFMRALLNLAGVNDRKVWLADSFRGLPAPDLAQFPADRGLNMHLNPTLESSLDEVRENFRRFGLLDEQVAFLPGWFKDTLPEAPIESLAILRLDADMYESTMDALSALYDKVSPGGYVIVDDYYSLRPCRTAVDEFRNSRGIGDELIDVDQDAVFWRKS